MNASLRQRLTNIPAPASLTLLYGVFILAGSVLLYMPFAKASAITFGDAVFTATSAVTVTGLIVVDTGSDFTFWGQLVIAILIQFGGLGLMTFAALVLSSLGLPIGMPQKIVLRQDLGQTSYRDLLELVKVVMKVALVCEVIGVAILSTVFIPEFGLSPGLWSAIFHTVSAFNNAGFALYPDSLSGWVGHPATAIGVPVMFIIGGLGFVVIADVAEKRAWRGLTLHSRLMIVGTLALIVWGVGMFGLLEWRNPETIGGLPTLSDKLMAAFFQGVTPRTAGFNTVDIGATHESTSMLLITLMLVGGGSTSTAGGIKVTTLIVLMLATVAFFRRRGEVVAFGRTVPLQDVLKVLALTSVSLIVVLMALFLITIGHQGRFLDYTFEVVSAFGTVGLSRGVTGELDGFGRAIIMLLMFLGRVGPLTLGFFLATRSVPRVRYPAGRIYLG